MRTRKPDYFRMADDSLTGKHCIFIHPVSIVVGKADVPRRLGIYIIQSSIAFFNTNLFVESQSVSNTGVYVDFFAKNSSGGSREKFLEFRIHKQKGFRRKCLGRLGPQGSGHGNRSTPGLVSGCARMGDSGRGCGFAGYKWACDALGCRKLPAQLAAREGPTCSHHHLRQYALQARPRARWVNAGTFRS
jgi:hypothetical protein